MKDPGTMTQALLTSAGLDEETARAEVYGLLAALYYAPPDAPLLEQLRAAVTEAPHAGAYLEEPWRVLVGLARTTALEAIASEYATLFGGVGKPAVYLFGSYYLSGFLNEKPLARLRTDVAALGLARDESMSETEDHVAYLCEVMRYLIAGDDMEVSNLTQQQHIFAKHIQPWVPRMCDAIAQHPAAHFYSAVAQFTQAFMRVEAQGFDLLP
jgi:TorA maturation chaperone TorD